MSSSATNNKTTSVLVTDTTRTTVVSEFNQVSASLPTQGSILVLKPAYNFNLPSYLSANSLGQFGLQIQLNCTNYLSDISNPEMVVIAVNGFDGNSTRLIVSLLGTSD